MSDFFTKILQRLRILPVLIVVASLAFMVRVGDAAFRFYTFSGEARAEEKAAVEAEKKNPEEVAKEKAIEAKGDKAAIQANAEPAIKPPAIEADGKAKAQTDPKKETGAETGKVAETSAAVPKWQSADEENFDDSKLREDLYKDLLQRRQQLDEKEKSLEQREALIKAATEEINKKAEELTAIKTEIRGLLKKQSSEEAANTARLVKIYEGMKPKEAARIFNALDMDVLLSVITQMSEKKSGSIIALMDPEKARNLTLFLSEQNKLPSAAPANARSAADSADISSDANKPPPVPEDLLQ